MAEVCAFLMGALLNTRCLLVHWVQCGKLERQGQVSATLYEYIYYNSTCTLHTSIYCCIDLRPLTFLLLVHSESSPIKRAVASLESPHLVPSYSNILIRVRNALQVLEPRRARPVYSSLLLILRSIIYSALSTVL